MTKRTLKFSLSSYWRVSTGAGAETLADSVVIRDAEGLPIVPGKAVKGLLREAMTLASISGAVAKDRVERWFGSPLAGFSDSDPDGDGQEKALEEGRFSSSEGALWFGSARLPSSWTAWARSHSEESKDVFQPLFRYVSSTAIDQQGMAEDHSLRVNEVTIPMDLRAEIRGPVDDLSWVKDIKTCLCLLRTLGTRRNRGFGRVQVTLEGE